MMSSIETVSTFAGSTNSGIGDGIGSNVQFNTPTGVTVDAYSGSIYISDYANNNIRKITMPEGIEISFYCY